LGEEESMQIRELLVPEFDFEMKKIRSTLERVPETKVEYKPHEKSMAIGKLAAHLARIPSWIVPIVDLPELDVATSGDTPQVMESSAKLLQGFDEHVRQARSALNKLEDTSLADPCKLLIQGTRYQMIRSLVLNHAIHHRGQLGVYLRLNNVAVPSIYGPSADES
jgi:uncharacterized damage-inducible protein DinB